MHSQVLGIWPYFNQPYLRWLWWKTKKRSKDPFPTQVMVGQEGRKEEKLGSKRVLTGESEARPCELESWDAGSRATHSREPKHPHLPRVPPGPGL